ncbi:MAG: anti-sigma F factor [Erysipelotrichaceae bacterium]|nr:anti-sigma F factor [Erysipelotrichaceae bacterium]
MSNSMELKFKASISNELLARQALIAFISPLNPTVDEIGEYKTIISEAVSNAIIHGYRFDASKDVFIKATIFEDEVEIIVRDYGVGIKNLEEAKTPHFSSRPDLERAGMGLTIIETLSDSFSISSVEGLGVKLIIRKKYSLSKENDEQRV